MHKAERAQAPSAYATSFFKGASRWKINLPPEYELFDTLPEGLRKLTFKELFKI